MVVQLQQGSLGCSEGVESTPSLEAERLLKLSAHLRRDGRDPERRLGTVSWPRAPERDGSALCAAARFGQRGGERRSGTADGPLPTPRNWTVGKGH